MSNPDSKPLKQRFSIDWDHNLNYERLVELVAALNSDEILANITVGGITISVLKEQEEKMYEICSKFSASPRQGYTFQEENSIYFTNTEI
jgi:L-amino acid N-acyltransferase YncA